ncbi:unnamed protein product [Vitrella brassicaformis CCMP3155]|uniref:C2 domain-containing protein n=1 Tax=Vitrella brassicaformis (strain CCMP3155) TaxID=1169540 RepID=A0A0G4F8C4_VITBC|nr:unnamed protein product [Vitrella brassicaformis CCMP3155]|eukprot:CEM08625.1 unnamed protein product [Vitrella brassicaformis CCMP3155]
MSTSLSSSLHPSGTRLEYLVKVIIHDVRDLVFKEGDQTVLPSPYVEVKVRDTVKRTSTKPQTATTFYNEILLFQDLSLSSKEFSTSTIDVRVYHQYMFTTPLVGQYVVAFPVAYGRPQHYIHRQWVLLSQPAGEPGEVKGYLRLSVGVFGPGDVLPSVKDTGADEEGGAAAEAGGASDMRFDAYQLNVNIHRALDLPRVEGFLTAINPFVQVKFMGLVCTSATLYDSVNPEWNETIRIPVIVPCMERVVVCEVWTHHISQTTFIGIDTIAFDRLLEERMKPRWTNLYWHPPAAGMSMMLDRLGALALGSKETSQQPVYAGRILLSASLQKTTTPQRTSAPCPRATDPPSQEFCIWTDLYEVAGLDAFSPTEIKVEVCMGPVIWRSRTVKKADEASFVFDDAGGRLEERKIDLPEPSEAFDLCLYVIGSSFFKGTQRIAFLRVPFVEVFKSGSGPKWHSLQPYQEGSAVEGSILVSFCAMESSKQPVRRGRVAYSRTKWLFRVYTKQ